MPVKRKTILTKPNRKVLYFAIGLVLGVALAFGIKALSDRASANPENQVRVELKNVWKDKWSKQAMIKLTVHNDSDEIIAIDRDLCGYSLVVDYEYMTNEFCEGWGGFNEIKPGDSVNYSLSVAMKDGAYERVKVGDKAYVRQQYSSNLGSQNYQPVNNYINSNSVKIQK